MKTRKRILSVIMAVAMVASMMFAMTANTYAATDENITVTVKFDTRSYDLSAKMVKSNGTLVSNSPVVEYTVTVPKGSTALYAVEKVASDNGFEVKTKDAADYYDPTIMHKAITDIGKVGETYIDPALKDAFITLPDPSSARGYYYVSGWVYGITPVNSTEFFPYDYMSDYVVSDGMEITMHYSVTGPYDVENEVWTADYSNLDVTMWNLYDKAVAAGTEDAMIATAMVDESIAMGAGVEANTTGLTAYYFSHKAPVDLGAMDINTLIELLNSVL